jgi:hypothetical protein
LTPLIISSYQSIVSIVSPGFYQKWKERFLKEKERMDGVASNQIKGLTQ